MNPLIHDNRMLAERAFYCFLSIELHPFPGTPDTGVRLSFPFRVRCQTPQIPLAPGRNAACRPAATSAAGSCSPAVPTQVRQFRRFAAASLLRSPAGSCSLTVQSSHHFRSCNHTAPCRRFCSHSPYPVYAYPAVGYLLRLFFRSSLRSPSDSDSCSTSAIPASKNRSSFSPVSNRSDITVCKPFWLCVCPPGCTSETMSVCPTAFFQNSANISERLFLALFCQHRQKVLQLPSRLYVHKRRLFCVFVIRERIAVFIGASPVGFGRCNPVHQHFCHIFTRHRHRSHSALNALRAVIHPVFVMMPVASFMMQPCRRIPYILPLRVVRASISLIIFCSDPKFRPGIFGKVMTDALPVQADRKASFHHQILMIGNRLKML